MTADRLRLLRELHCYTLVEVATHLGVTESIVSRYETPNVKTRRRPSAEAVNALADFYGVSTDFIFGRSCSEAEIRCLSSLSPEKVLRERLGVS